MESSRKMLIARLQSDFHIIWIKVTHFETAARLEVKLQDGKVKNTPFTSPPNTTVTFAEAAGDKRLDVESVGGKMLCTC